MQYVLPSSANKAALSIATNLPHSSPNLAVLGPAGPKLKFHTDLVVAVTGAAFDAQLDGKHVPLWKSFKAPKGSTLTIGKVSCAMQSLQLTDLLARFLGQEP